MEPIRAAAFTPLGEAAEGKRWRARPLTWMVAGALLLFALVLWFLFTAQSVLFTFSPKDSRLQIQGGMSFQIGERYLMRSGDYGITVTATGHYPHQETVTIADSDGQSFHYDLRRLPGRISFLSQPTGARISVADRELGQTPMEDAEVPAGEQELAVTRERYLPQRQVIDVTGMGERQQFEFTLDPAWADIGIDTSPRGATVYLDGEPVGTTPVTLEVLQGEHQLSLELARHRPWQTQLEVLAGVAQVLEPVILQPADGLLDLRSSPSRANVTVNGEYRGQTPVELELAPGVDHRIAVFKAGYSNSHRIITMEAEEEREITIRLKPQLGEVLIKVEPADAEVFIDGTSSGTGSQRLTLPAFEQTLTVSRRGFSDYRQRFTPRQGLSQVLNVRLLSAEEARLAALKPRITSPAGQQLLLFTPGDFTMGASRREPGRRANEVLHPVSLKRLFYLAEKEVTNKEFRQFKTDHNSGRVQTESLNTDRQPAVMVSWNDAARYCNWLSAKEKLEPFYQVENGVVTGFTINALGYRLPSEAEWAWAARVRGEETLKFGWGDRFPPREVVDNFADTSSAYITGRTVNGYNDGYVLSAPVGSFPPNHNRLFDIGGNVAEWVHDVYIIPSSSGIAVSDPLGAQVGQNHVIRGASWAQGTVTELRLSFRDYGNEGRDDVGFRVARYAEEKQ